MIQKLRAVLKEIVFSIFSLFPPLNIIVFESTPDFSDNSFEIYKYLIEHSYNKTYRFIWVVKSYSAEKKYDCTVVRFRSFKAYLYSYLAKYTFYSHQFIGNPKNKRQRRVFLVHGFSFKNSKGLFWNEEYNTDIICLSEFHKEKRMITMPKAGERSIITGFPRNDRLFRKNNNVRSLFNVMEEEKLIIWLPTFRHGKKELGNRKDIPDGCKEFELLNHETLRNIDEFLIKNKCKLIVKYHPGQDPSYVSISDKYKNIMTLLSKDFLNYNISLYDLLAVSDALISDFSSVYVDYLLLNKPIAFDISDIEAYSNGLGFIVPDPKLYMPGHLIQNVQQLDTFINDVVNCNDKYANEREIISKKIHAYRDGKSTERVIKAIQI